MTPAALPRLGSRRAEVSVRIRKLPDKTLTHSQHTLLPNQNHPHPHHTPLPQPVPVEWMLWALFIFPPTSLLHGNPWGASSSNRGYLNQSWNPVVWESGKCGFSLHSFSCGRKVRRFWNGCWRSQSTVFTPDRGPGVPGQRAVPRSLGLWGPKSTVADELLARGKSGRR